MNRLRIGISNEGRNLTRLLEQLSEECRVLQLGIGVERSHHQQQLRRRRRRWWDSSGTSSGGGGMDPPCCS
eukprot:NODE_5534_length_1760_cov_5.044703.p10 GENE.NODE_5534_length_1760_cov_5.044703~~NODE_5534_length_1760_cov_5.044703.p10  ORF type:complete len:71 (-),score=7.40 NODE_5534_length_1760_cov_5.044703:344-556(-)